MITEDYVSFETAKLLKEKGFDAPLHVYYSNDGLVQWMTGKKYTRNKELSTNACIRPTHQMVMKWLREVHNIHIEVRITNHSFSSLIDIPRYYWIIFNAKEVKWMDESTAHESMSYETVEEAAEAAIKYYLENLI